MCWYQRIGIDHISLLMISFYYFFMTAYIFLLNGMISWKPNRHNNQILKRLWSYEFSKTLSYILCNVFDLLRLVMHVWFNNLGHHWFKWGLGLFWTNLFTRPLTNYYSRQNIMLLGPHCVYLSGMRPVHSGMYTLHAGCTCRTDEMFK